MIEIWKDIKGYEGLYQVSNLGNVKSLNYNKTKKEKQLTKLTIMGYIKVGLSKNGKVKVHFVHRLVWEAFNGPIPEGMCVNHINEDKTDNRYPENLNLMTHRENNNWGTRNKRISEKRRNGKGSKPVLQYDLEGNFIKEWPNAYEIERQLGFSQANINKCCLEKFKKSHSYIWKYKEKAA